MRRLLLSLIPKRAPVVSLSLFFSPRTWCVGVLFAEQQTMFLHLLPMIVLRIHWRMEDV